MKNTDLQVFGNFHDARMSSSNFDHLTDPNPKDQITETMNTTENNKLIAEFMDYPDLGTKGDFFYLKYNKSWDWLMPAVDKIDSILSDDNLVTITYNRCLIEWYEEGITFEGLGNTKIEATFNAVVEFAKWYKENK